MGCDKMSQLRVSPRGEALADSAVAQCVLGGSGSGSGAFASTTPCMPLEQLDLAGFSVTDLMLLEGLGGFKKSLHVLTLSNNHITDYGISSLNCLDFLKELNLDRTGVTDGIFVIIKDLRHLEVLSVSETHVSDKGVKVGVKSEWFKSLRRLNLARTGVTDGGVAVIAAGFPNLISLNLDYTHVTLSCRLVLQGHPSLKPVRLAGITTLEESVLRIE